MRIWPRNLLELIVCQLLLIGICIGTQLIVRRLHIDYPAWYYRTPPDTYNHMTTRWWGNKFVDSPGFATTGKNVDCRIDEEDNLVVSSPNGWAICLRATSCFMPTGESCTRLRWVQ